MTISILFRAFAPERWPNFSNFFRIPFPFHLPVSSVTQVYIQLFMFLYFLFLIFSLIIYFLFRHFFQSLFILFIAHFNLYDSHIYYVPNFNLIRINFFFGNFNLISIAIFLYTGYTIGHSSRITSACHCSSQLILGKLDCIF